MVAAAQSVQSGLPGESSHANHRVSLTDAAEINDRAQRLLHSKQFIISACVVKEVRVTMLQFAFTSSVINS